MVYSTSKPKVYDQIVNLGINLATKKVINKYFFLHKKFY